MLPEGRGREGKLRQKPGDMDVVHTEMVATRWQVVGRQVQKSQASNQKNPCCQVIASTLQSLP